MSTIKNIAKANKNAARVDALTKKNTHKTIAMGIGGGTTLVGAIAAGIYGRKLKKDFRNLKADNEFTANKLSLNEQIKEAEDNFIEASNDYMTAVEIATEFDTKTNRKPVVEKLLKVNSSEIARITSTSEDQRTEEQKNALIKLTEEKTKYENELKEIEEFLKDKTADGLTKLVNETKVAYGETAKTVKELKDTFDDNVAEFEKARDEAKKTWWEKHKDKKNNKKNNNDDNNNNGNNNGANNGNNGNGTAK